MTQQEFNEMLSVAVAQGIVGGTYILKHDEEEIDKAVGRALPGGEIDNLRPGQNLLDNWYFADPINQRGKTEYSHEYSIDRFYASANGVIRLLSDGIMVYRKTLGYSYSNLHTYIEGSHILGKTVTLSALANGELFTITGTIPKTPEPNTTVIAGDKGKKVWVQVHAINNGILDIGFVNSSDTSYTVVAMKLELGSVQTLAHQDASGNWVLNDPPPNKALELAKCQRYQLVMKATTKYHRFGCLGIAVDSTYMQIPLPLPVTLRGMPSITLSKNIAMFDVANDREVPITSVALYDMDDAQIVLSIASNSVTKGSIYQLRANDSTARIIIDANL